MLAETLEQIRSQPAKRTAYVRFALAALAAIIALKTLWFARWGLWDSRSLADFDAFHIVARQVWLGDLDQVYRFASFTKLQEAAAGGATGAMPWTYPPQFDLLLAPLAYLPLWGAYLSFTAATLALYLATLRAIAGDRFAHVLVVVFPALAITIGCGQNGFLTGALIGLFCLNAQRRETSSQLLAGLALGAMVIKPHLAIAASVYLLATRRWTAVAASAAVVLTSSAICTLTFGPAIWTALLGSIKESADFLDRGSYQLFRMISTYAAFYMAGVPAAGAIWAQAIVAMLALLTVVLAVVRGPSPAAALGVTAMISVMISPYAYDYDLPMVGVGLVLLLPDLAGIASPRERGTAYGLILVAGAYGLLQSTTRFGSSAPAVAGLAMMALLALLLKILLRDARQLRPSAAPA
ncbi:glycosyltransferase family 87 protein [Bradyrhizobium sp.]|uniref:glycosyltransferase family 87 protein n=1 Tax=Bradyrhizobium sp. TaxID=376 RepID=UPI00238EB874|nr:glycosyltransferase family 87 protein [Bradyrhizobium sp.]MDE2378569.1 DUF2029 domain-containing protein [Bradyrhizobium sp.]